MSKEKQIEEIKDHIDSIYGCDCAYYGVDGLGIATELYNAGYRKQSEGEWEKLDHDHFNCTHCGNIFALGSTATIYNVQRTWKYCSNCGAKMKGV